MSVGIDFNRLLVALVTGPPGPPEMRAPSPIPRPAPLNGLGRGVFCWGSRSLPLAAPVPPIGPHSNRWGETGPRLSQQLSAMFPSRVSIDGRRLFG